MIISDLEVLEVVREDENVVGGLAIAQAEAKADAKGPNFAISSTYTETDAKVVPGYYGYHYYKPGYSKASAKSSSYSAAG